jgi:hypothetical protein
MINLSKNYENHKECTCVIIERLHVNRLHPVPGLYCEKHSKLIKWLNPKDFKFLVRTGIKNLGMLKGEKEIYDRRVRLLDRQ